MHNCKETKERLIELALDQAVLPAELSKCDECRAEFEALNATLRATTRLRETVSPPEDYWIGYHMLLREKLSRAKTQRRKEEIVVPVFASSFAPLRLCGRLLARSLKSSVPVPVPVGIALILLFSLLALFAIRQRTAPPQSPIVVQVPVEVPVIQEKTVTQVIYRDRRRTSKPSKRTALTPASESTFARSQPINLDGFKPTDEIKLTVIKGGVPNEK
jgi:hypothetical protein